MTQRLSTRQGLMYQDGNYHKLTSSGPSRIPCRAPFGIVHP
eukprot:CAMPEP_0202898492 /NCGR_PEP_ID=MMETSP1392-20130828/7009_1 /ASSEMBLY_ACC=CAM_ASM_000868 /TAXON_ID=225041 /ORGANISM="Chlamydomonas chlamydogama, Strain SAG 11-48b" /LENGTH=40 /DNA_ID= /DNA_START= /DNA_END= /DNA_ORIENTATION=